MKVTPSPALLTPLRLAAGRVCSAAAYWSQLLHHCSPTALTARLVTSPLHTTLHSIVCTVLWLCGRLHWDGCWEVAGTPKHNEMCKTGLDTACFSVRVPLEYNVGQQFHWFSSLSNWWLRLQETWPRLLLPMQGTDKFQAKHGVTCYCLTKYLSH